MRPVILAAILCLSGCYSLAPEEPDQYVVPFGFTAGMTVSQQFDIPVCLAHPASGLDAVLARTSNPDVVAFELGPLAPSEAMSTPPAGTTCFQMLVRAISNGKARLSFWLNDSAQKDDPQVLTITVWLPTS